MGPLIRDQLKTLFKKVKHLHLPSDLEEVNFEPLIYFSWTEESDKSLYLVYEYKRIVTGLRLQFIRSRSNALQLGFCEFCHKHRKRSEVLFVATETKKRPKHVVYRSRGTWLCSDYQKCNHDMKNDDLIKEFYFRILDDAS
jgi:hypothetical protein